MQVDMLTGSPGGHGCSRLYDRAVSAVIALGSEYFITAPNQALLGSLLGLCLPV